MRFTALLVVAACLLMAPAEPPKGQNDPQSTFEPRSGPGAGHKFLEKFVGDWEVAKAFFPRTGEPVHAEGHCRQTMIHDGRFLQSEFVFVQGEKMTTGLGMIGFEPEAGTFTSFWTDSRQTRMSVRQSREPFDGLKIVLYNRSVDADGKDSRSSKTISRLEENGRKLIHRQYALGSDGAERLMMELVMTRKPDAPAPSQ
jgi:hypothetical protein